MSYAHLVMSPDGHGAEGEEEQQRDGDGQQHGDDVADVDSPGAN